MSGPFDRQRRRAVDALAKRVRERDASGVPADPELFALEFIAALCGQGWRPVAALEPHEQADPPAQSLPPEYLAVKAALTQKGTPDGS